MVYSSSPFLLKENHMAKIQLTFKTPDATYQIEDFEDLNPTVFNMFLKYRELVTIEFDTENLTATVIPLK